MRVKDADGKPTDTTRAQKAEEDGGSIELPEVSAAYLLQYLQDLGVYGFGAMGPIPLSATEINAWATGSGIALLPWEFEALRLASRAYVSEYGAEHDEPPYGEDETLADPDVIDDKLRGLFRSLAQPRNR